MRSCRSPQPLKGICRIFRLATGGVIGWAPCIKLERERKTEKLAGKDIRAIFRCQAAPTWLSSRSL